MRGRFSLDSLAKSGLKSMEEKQKNNLCKKNASNCLDFCLGFSELAKQLRRIEFK